jgi:hypothetical protein
MKVSYGGWCDGLPSSTGNAEPRGGKHKTLKENRFNELFRFHDVIGLLTTWQKNANDFDRVSKFRKG